MISEDLFYNIILYFILFGMLASIAFVILAFVVIIKELRGKEVKRDEAKKVDSQADRSRHEQGYDE